MDTIADTLTPAMSSALAVLKDRRGTASELGFGATTLIGLVDRGLARVEADALVAYRISPRGREIVEELLNPTPCRRVTVHDIQEETARHFRIPLIEMTSDRRSREVAWPRQVAMYLSKKLTPLSLPTIGRLFGGRDHSTVIHAVRAVEKRISARHVETTAALQRIEADTLRQPTLGTP